MSPRVTIDVVRLDQRVAVCHVCDAESPPRWGIPIFEGAVVPNAWPGEWGGVDACQACWARQQVLTEPIALWQFRQGKELAQCSHA